MGRIEKLKRQLIKEANIRVLKEQTQDITTAIDNTATTPVIPPTPITKDPIGIATSIIDATRNLSDYVGLPGGTREEQLYEALKLIKPSNAARVGVELDKLLDQDWESNDLAFWKTGLLGWFIKSHDKLTHKKNPRKGIDVTGGQKFSSNRVDTLGGGLDRLLRVELEPAEYKKASQILIDNGFKKIKGKEQYVRRQGVTQFSLWVPKETDIPKTIAYTVQPGEDLDAIAEKYGLQTYQLINLNDGGYNKPLSKYKTKWKKVSEIYKEMVKKGTHKSMTPDGSTLMVPNPYYTPPETYD